MDADGIFPYKLDVLFYSQLMFMRYFYQMDAVVQDQELVLLLSLCKYEKEC